ncbi:hypothetical protein J8TS2_23780 [Lederbergia ruris]|uniref:Uncharacterized protein n=1 Tax=Lederbergia ruris TaxID=217495 RepID=A0ABQ4KLN5_9BACI|nr:hypothetical protein J8TS2_23780 [Lederbergia ruris]
MKLAIKMPNFLRVIDEKMKLFLGVVFIKTLLLLLLREFYIKVFSCQPPSLSQGKTYYEQIDLKKKEKLLDNSFMKEAKFVE